MGVLTMGILIGLGLLLAMCLVGYAVMVAIATYHFNQAPDPVALSEPLPFISVVIAARNEADHLPACLESVASQTYPGPWELILVDDHSEDASTELVPAILERHVGLSSTYISSKDQGKKAAIQAGVTLASGEWILQTDADCVVTSDWLNAMSRWMSSEVGFISGPIRLEPGFRWLDRLQALETLGLVTLGAGSLLGGFPNMANGANMAYRRSLFQDIGGFAGAVHIASGDDEFLLQKIEMDGRYRLAFAKDIRAVVVTDPLPTWRQLKQQRLRWVSKARAYLHKRSNWLQIMSWLGFVAFPWWLLISTWVPGALIVLALLCLVKVCVDHWLMRSGAVFLQITSWLRWFWALEMVYIPYVIWIGVVGNLVKTYTWKDRSVK